MATIALNSIIGNEIKIIDRFLTHVTTELYDIFDEIVIGCNGTDGTYERCLFYQEQFPKLRIYKTEWIGDFAFSRNEIREKTESDLIFMLDCDDYIDPKSLEVIRSKEFQDYLSTAQNKVTYFKINSTKEDIIISTFNQIRIFPKNLKWIHKIHETVDFQKDTEHHLWQNISIIHLGYAEHLTVKQKAFRNLELLVANPENNPRYYSNVSSCLSILGEHDKSIKNYNHLLNKYPLDSVDGYYYNYSLARYHYIKEEFSTSLEYFRRALIPESLAMIGMVFDATDFLDFYISSELLSKEDIDRLDLLKTEMAEIFYKAFDRQKDIKGKEHLQDSNIEQLIEFVEKRLEK